MKPQDYMNCALRTLYPDLSTNERLGLCGLGLSGEIGEVTDLLKKYLYHRNGKPLDVNKLKDEMGDVLWYYFVLLDTLGLTFEQARHANGFNARYQSDSGSSGAGASLFGTGFTTGGAGGGAAGGLADSVS